jgi:hypothetical protein
MRKFLLGFMDVSSAVRDRMESQQQTQQRNSANSPAGTSAATAWLLEILTLMRVDTIAGVGNTREGVVSSTVSPALCREAPEIVIRPFVGVFGPVGSSTPDTTTNKTNKPAKTIGVPQLLILTIFVSHYSVKVGRWLMVWCGVGVLFGGRTGCEPLK